MTAEEWAYAAGFFDGEGSVNITARQATGLASYRAQILVWNTNREVLDWLCARWGGKVHVARRTNPTRHVAQAYQWVPPAHSLLPFLRGIRPYLIVKAVVVDNAIDFLQIQLAMRSPGARRLRLTESHMLEERYKKHVGFALHKRA